jgi:hypothetical protein
MTERFAREVLRAAEHLALEPRGQEILDAACDVVVGRGTIADLAEVLERNRYLIVLPPPRSRVSLT